MIIVRSLLVGVFLLGLFALAACDAPGSLEDRAWLYRPVCCDRCECPPTPCPPPTDLAEFCATVFCSRNDLYCWQIEEAARDLCAATLRGTAMIESAKTITGKTTDQTGSQKGR